MISLLNELEYDVWVPGNHDFEFGPEPLVSAAREFRGATLGAEFARDGFRPGAWTLLARNGYRIAVTGMTDPKMPSPAAAGFRLELRIEPRRAAPHHAGNPRRGTGPDRAGLALRPLHSAGTMFRFLAESPKSISCWPATAMRRSPAAESPAHGSSRPGVTPAVSRGLRRNSTTGTAGCSASARNSCAPIRRNRPTPERRGCSNRSCAHTVPSRKRCSP